MKYTYAASILFIAGLLCSCGDGEWCCEDYDDDMYEVYMGGLWRGSLSMVKNDCALPLARNYIFTHLVSQNYTSLELKDENDRYFVGQTVGEDGFSVDSPGPEINVGGRGCTVTYRYRYDSINDDDDPTAQVRFLIIGHCSGGRECESEYSGDGARD